VTNLIVPAFFLVFSIVLGWLAGPVFRLSGTTLLVLRVGLALFGMASAFLAYWFWSRHQNGTPRTASSPETSELLTLIRSGSQILQRAQRSSGNALMDLPLLYVLGAPNSGKTTTISKSGLDPELLAGQVFQDGAVVPTHLLNLWYAGESVFVDAGEPLTREAKQWSTVVRRTSPGFVSSLTRRNRLLRAAVVCISSEVFFGPDAAEKLASLARETNANLREISRQLGADLPVHVILTKLDRVVGFAEYTQHLTQQEASERLGIMFPMESPGDSVYAERSSALVSSFLDQLLFSLGEFRLEMLGRESNAANIPGIYQFPREMQKLRSHLTNYLVELARPSHLNANPVLRSFSCIGVRAQILEPAVVKPAPMPRGAALADADATGIFSLREIQAAEAPLRSGATRRVAQWCFLPQLFPQVFLVKSEQESAAGASTRVVMLRRVAFAVASFIFLVWGIGLTVSYINNAALERDIRDTATSLSNNGAPVDFASVQQLSALNRLRLDLLQLQDFDQQGAPWRFRWGLYSGHALIATTRALYFERFRWLLLDATQTRLRDNLNALPATAPGNADYLAAYNPLRAYLITTSFPQYSTGDFLAPVLTRAWLAGHTGQEDQKQLASEQFRFFGDELRLASTYHIEPNVPTVIHAQAYLNSFGSFDRVYQNMLAEANRSASSIDFNRMFPGSAATVVETYVIAGAFTRAGYTFMQAAIRNPERFFMGEPWVLGNQTAILTSSNSLSSRLADRYAEDFSAQWQNYLRAASVVRFHSLSEAGQKLGSLSSPNSALLALVFTASQNTAVSDASVAREFQPTQALVPPDLRDRFIAPPNTAYVNGLVALQGAVSQFAQDPNVSAGPTVAQGVISAAIGAHSAVSQTAQAFDVDPQAHIEQTLTHLLQEPITSVEELIRGAAPAQINGAGRQFCAVLAPVLAKYPFSRSATAEATPAEVAMLLQPETGALWQFYTNNLKSLVIQQGTQWIAQSTANPKPTPQFMQFFNELARFSNAMFPAGATTPSLQFTVHIPQSPGIQSVTLALDKQKTSGADVTHVFNWSPQNSQQAQLIASYGSNNLPLQFSGNWALFHLVDRGRVEQAANPTRLAYPLEISGTPIVLNGQSLTERIELSGPGAAILTPGARSGLHCVPQIAR
jgi:type VI secretion system protein ImpL